MTEPQKSVGMRTRHRMIAEGPQLERDIGLLERLEGVMADTPSPFLWERAILEECAHRVYGQRRTLFNRQRDACQEIIDRRMDAAPHEGAGEDQDS